MGKPTALNMTTIPGVELAKIGTYHAGTGTLTLTREQLNSAVSASRDPKLRDPIVKLGHKGGDFGDAFPNFGFIKNMRTADTDDGSYTLLGDLEVPAALAAVSPVAFPSRSVEIAYDYQANPMSRLYPFVVTAVSLLGETMPAIQSLGDVFDMFGVDAALSSPTETITITPEVEMRTAQLSIAISSVVDQFYDQLKTDNPNSWAYVQEPYDDSLIVTGTDGEFYRVSWTADDEGVVTFGTPVRVAIAYVPDPDSQEDGPTPTFAQLSRSCLVPPVHNLGGSVQSFSMNVPTETITAEQVPNVETTDATVTAELSGDTTTEVIADSTETVATPVLAELSATAKNLGLELVSTETVAQLQAAQVELAELRTQVATAELSAAAEKRDASLEKAIAEGRFPRAMLSSYQKLYDIDPDGTLSFINEIPTNTIPVAAVGGIGNAAAISQEAALAAYNALPGGITPRRSK